MKYDYKAIEKKWQDIWDAENTFAAKQDFSLPKYYALVEFPYPSGQGLHVGHPRSYTALDIVARKKRLCGYNVLYPMGWDASAAHGKLRHEKPHPPRGGDGKQTWRASKASSRAWAFPSTGRGRSTPRTPAITNGPVDLSAAV